MCRSDPYRLSILLLLFFTLIPPLEASVFKIASYNVENLFDAVTDGTEYRVYVPDTRHGWNREMARIKTANIARVIKDLNADVVALQEVESKRALIALKQVLKDSGTNYPYVEITAKRTTPVTCAVLSVFPIIEKKEIEVDDERLRNILQITLDVYGHPITLFINHWKSKSRPESLRVISARTLRRAIDRLDPKAEFVLIGDFNSNHNEFETFRNKTKLNNTGGMTGINQILGTVQGTRMINETDLTNQAGNRFLYNLWLEVQPSRRWSYNLFGRKETPDSIILSKALYDDRGISYVDNSFYKFHPDYLFNDRALYRWQITRKGKGRHLGRGYSDHLPIFAYFSTTPFQFKTNPRLSEDTHSSMPKHAKGPTVRLDLNRASQEALMSISGIGSVLSRRIIAGRPYGSVDDLVRVNGIGSKKLEQLRKFFIVK